MLRTLSTNPAESAAPVRVLPPDIAALADGPMSAEDVRVLRRWAFAEENVSLAVAEKLFLLSERVGDRGSREWHDAFVEAITEVVVHQADPPGFPGEHRARWLIDQISRDGRVLLKTEFAALLRVMEKARVVPDLLATFALNLIKHVVLTGDGTSITGERHAPGMVTKADVEALRRVLFVASSEGFGQVTRAEAEVLFEIADLTIDAQNDPSFEDLFARAVGNHILSAGGRPLPSVAQAVRREQWLTDDNSLGGIGGFFTSVLSAVIARGAGGTQAGGPQEAAPPVTLAPEYIDEEEARWLAERIGRSGRTSPAERRLLAFLQEEAGILPDTLRKLAA